MSKTRDNHYAPVWYQKGFTIDGNEKLRYLSLEPKNIELPNGDIKQVFTNRWNYPSQCFYQTDLYTTFFGEYVNDDIERKLFGEIDNTGSMAVRAFIGEDFGEQHNNFEAFFTYLDAQKTRTPKGLDWIRANYPSLSQPELMHEMQALRNIHCTIWTEGVREIVSAENSAIKFLVSDHPVTIYNYAFPPDSERCNYPGEPDIAAKASQTIYALDKNYLLILTNLEYAKDPDGCDPTQSRTYSQRVRQSLVRTDTFIRTRKLNASEVAQINFILKSRAKQYIAAGNKDWLYPEKHFQSNWDELRYTLLPPKDQLHKFGGEIYASYKDGSTHYQDEFGRTTPQNNFLDKSIDETSLRPDDDCGCGSGIKYKKCCRDVPVVDRPTWKVLSIRERNLTLYNAIYDILGFNDGKTWDIVRSEINDDQIRSIYGIYAQLWPIETDIYELLPKPGNKLIGMYSGIIDARTISRRAEGLSIYFDELLIQHPFVNPNNVKPEFSPVESPSTYKYQALKDIYFLLKLEPLVSKGLVCLMPDPCSFDEHLQRQVLNMARQRKWTVKPGKNDETMCTMLNIESILHTMTGFEDDLRESLLRGTFPHLGDAEQLHLKESLEVIAEHDPLALLQDERQQLMLFSLGPNYEMSLFIAQVTGAVIITDSDTRWSEFQQAQHREDGTATYPWQKLSAIFEEIAIPREPGDILDNHSTPILIDLREKLKDMLKMISECREDNEEVAALEKRLQDSYGLVQRLFRKNDYPVHKVSALMPKKGFKERYVQRLLVTSGSQKHKNSVSLVLYVEP